MNNVSRTVATLIHYNVLIRDTLEYTLNKPSYDLNFYNYKKNGIKIELDEKTPLALFIEKNGEAGEKLKKSILDFYDKIYGNDSTILRVSGGALKVDKAQNIAVLEAVLPLHEELRKVIDAHLDFARKENSLEPEIEELVKADEKFYRGIVFMAIVPELESLFIEYNKVRQEAKGAITPQSNFLNNDLGKVMSLLEFSRQNARVIDREYTDLLDKVFDLVEEMRGRRELRAGRNFQMDFNDVKVDIQGYVSRNEPLWKEKYDKLMKELIEQAQKEQAAKSNDGGIANNA